MIVKWKAHTWSGHKIERVECERETDSTVWVLERSLVGDKSVVRRYSKRSDSFGFYDSWEDAHAELLRRAEDRLELCRDRLRRAQDEYGNIKGMKKPEAETP